ncbi:putative NAD-dependent epimerase/dehydratase [Paenibacillus glycanilyticus]|uniref:NAD-dependent epimerase/dehydratase n=1 Tax=Paenibacillus glycanilyticus TaxID=126569 RepID=A0ABQ6NG25_9BACL|nr:SDR family oxidoreductase [Paenibacillus glycanilyticus]GMK43683.1 putative NAD-dependent epimerase/dehydratase [Paenibacillus glycanilyticus]
MRIFVTGATGYIGTEVVRELIEGGHEVVGLTRSDKGVALLEAAGAEAHLGTLEDLDSLQRGAAAADGVIHLAFRHDFSDFDGSLAMDLRAVEAMGAVLEGSGKPFVITAHANGMASEEAVLGLAERGVRTSIVSLAPSVHGEKDKGFVPQLIQTAREKGFSAYIGYGANRWPAVHRIDAASLFRLAVEAAPAGSRLDGVGDEGIAFRDIAAVIGRHLNVPVRSISREEAAGHFGFLGMLAGLDFPRSSAETQKLLGWKPVHPGLIEDLEQGHYFNK